MPLRELALISNDPATAVSMPSSVGTLPVRRLMLMSSDPVMAVSRPTSDGIVPLKPPSLRMRLVVIAVRSPISDGIVPVRLFPRSQSELTSPPLHPMPCQVLPRVHGSPLIQWVLVIQPAPPAAAYSAPRACTCVVGVAGCGDGAPGGAPGGGHMMPRLAEQFDDERGGTGHVNALR